MVFREFRGPSSSVARIELAENKDTEQLTVFNSKYVVPGPKTMMLHLKAQVFSFSGDTYKIKDSNNENTVGALWGGTALFGNGGKCHVT